MIVISIQVSVMSDEKKTGVGTTIGPIYFKSGVAADVMQKKIEETTKGYGERFQTILPNVQIRFELTVSQEIPDALFISFFQQDVHNSLDEFIVATQNAARGPQSPEANAQLQQLLANIKAQSEAAAANNAPAPIDAETATQEAEAQVMEAPDGEVIHVVQRDEAITDAGAPRSLQDMPPFEESDKVMEAPIVVDEQEVTIQ